MKKLNYDNVKSSLAQIGGVIAGVAASYYVNKLSKEGVSGLFGDEETTPEAPKAQEESSMKKYLVPALEVVGGLAAASLMESKVVQSFGAGLAAGGGVRIANEAAGKEIVSLKGVGDTSLDMPRPSTEIFMPRALPVQTPVVNGTAIMPGIGSTDIMPGMGETGVLSCY